MFCRRYNDGKFMLKSDDHVFDAGITMAEGFVLIGVRSKYGTSIPAWITPQVISTKVSRCVQGVKMGTWASTCGLWFCQWQYSVMHSLAAHDRMHPAAGPPAGPPSLPPSRPLALCVCLPLVLSLALSVPPPLFASARTYTYVLGARLAPKLHLKQRLCCLNAPQGA